MCRRWGDHPDSPPPEKEAIIDACRALDRLHNGKDDSAIIDMLQDAHPQLNRKQVSNAWHRSIKPHGHKLGKYAAQASSKDRSGAVTVPNQTRYYHLVDAAHDEADAESTKACPLDKNGKSWRELSAHFIEKC